MISPSWNLGGPPGSGERSLTAGVDDVLAVVVDIPHEGLEPALADIATGDLDPDLLPLVPEAAGGDNLDVHGDDLAGLHLLVAGMSLDRIIIGGQLFIQSAAGDAHLAPDAGVLLPEQGDGQELSLGAQLLDVDKEVGVVVALGGYPQVELHVAGELGVLREGVIKGDLLCLALVGGVGLGSHRGGLHRHIGGVQIQLLVLDTLQGEVFLGPVRHVVERTHVLDLDPDFWGQLPTVPLQLQIAGKEPLQLLEVLVAVSIGPLKVPMDSEPLLPGLALPERIDGAPQMEVVPAGGLIDGNGHVLPDGVLVLPV